VAGTLEKVSQLGGVGISSTIQEALQD